jgi:hypothetical protein
MIRRDKMTFYQKKPIIVEAFRWTGDEEQTEDPIWIIEAIKNGNAYFERHNFYIRTLEGVMQVGYGDYVIKGIKGEIYPCKPDIFEASYSEIEIDAPCAE